jgi:Spy/CpxP family protein refolding chaperone
MKKRIMTLALVTLMLLGVTYVYAQSPGPGPGPGFRWGERHRWGSSEPGMSLNLTPEQKTKFQEIHRKFMEENAQLIGALITKRLELRSLWTDPKSDPKAILDKEKELRALQNQMRDKVIQAMLEARKTLTPEQLAKFGLDWGMGGGGMMGHGHGMGSDW